MDARLSTNDDKKSKVYVSWSPPPAAPKPSLACFSVSSCRMSLPGFRALDQTWSWTDAPAEDLLRLGCVTWSTVTRHWRK
jgi:hypothetical protein